MTTTTTTRYEITGWLKTTAEDSYEQGELDRGHEFSGDARWHADT